MKKIDLTQGKVLSVIIGLALPMVGSSLLQFTYNLVDMLFVGRLGSDAVASVGTTGFILGLGYSINALVVIGCGIKVSHGIGKKNDREVQDYINAGFRVNFFIATAFMLIMLFFGKSLISFFELNNPNVEDYSYLFLAISAPMMFLAFFNILYSRILSSYGNNKAALKINAAGIIVNIILDPILIYWLDFGVLGAAVATLIGNMVVFGLFFYQTRSLFKVNFFGKVNRESTKEIVRLGLPMSSQRILFTVVNIILAKMIAHFGTDAIAAQKIGLQIESIALMVLGGLNGAMASFVGQNYGAGKFDRINKGYYTTITIGSVYAAVLGLVFVFTPEFLVRIFIQEPSTIAMSSGYLKYIGIALVFSGIEMISNGAFTGLGMPKIPATISIIFTILRIPFAIILIPYFGVNGIWLSIALSSILKGVLASLMYKLKVRRKFAHA